jgi:hypothetical protein
MLLKCTCANSTVDVLYGRNIRNHTKLVKQPGIPQEFICNCCNFVRGLDKSTAKREHRLKKGQRQC